MNLSLPLDQRTWLGLCAVLGVMVFITFIADVWQWHNDWALAHQTTPPRAVSPDDGANTNLIASLPQQHLFGQSLLADGEVPVTNLQLRVTGITKVIDEQNNDISKADISIAGGTGKIYRVGDELPDGVKIYQIDRDAVILENDGHLEKLPLPRETLKSFS